MAGTATLLGGKAAFHRKRGVVRLEAAFVCDGSGVVSAALLGEAWGRVVAVFDDGGLATSAVVTVTDAKTGATVLTYTVATHSTPSFRRPSTNIVDVAGATVAANAVAPNVMRDVKVAGKLNVSVASGGAASTGKMALIIDEAGLGIKAVNV